MQVGQAGQVEVNIMFISSIHLTYSNMSTLGPESWFTLGSCHVIMLQDHIYNRKITISELTRL